MTDIHPLIAKALAAPKTHEVVTTYADGAVRRLATRSAASAETYAVGERRKLGRDLIDRETGETVRVVAVDIRPLTSTASMSLSDLPTDDGTLYLIAFADGTETGIGTADEIRAFVADGIMPDSIIMRRA